MAILPSSIWWPIIRPDWSWPANWSAGDGALGSPGYWWRERERERERKLKGRVGESSKPGRPGSLTGKMLSWQMGDRRGGGEVERWRWGKCRLAGHCWSGVISQYGNIGHDPLSLIAYLERGDQHGFQCRVPVPDGTGLYRCDPRLPLAARVGPPYVDVHVLRESSECSECVTEDKSEERRATATERMKGFHLG